MQYSDGYNQAIDVLSQLRVGNVIGDSLRAQALEVIESQFTTLVDERDIQTFNALLSEPRVSDQLRDSWTETVLDIWHVSQSA